MYEPYANSVYLNDEQIAKQLQEELDRESALALNKPNSGKITNINPTVDDEQLAKEEQFNNDRDALFELAQSNSSIGPVFQAYHRPETHIPVLFSDELTQQEITDYEVMKTNLYL